MVFQPESEASSRARRDDWDEHTRRSPTERRHRLITRRLRSGATLLGAIWLSGCVFFDSEFADCFDPQHPDEDICAQENPGDGDGDGDGDPPMGGKGPGSDGGTSGGAGARQSGGWSSGGEPGGGGDRSGGGTGGADTGGADTGGADTGGADTGGSHHSTSGGGGGGFSGGTGGDFGGGSGGVSVGGSPSGGGGTGGEGSGGTSGKSNRELLALMTINEVRRTSLGFIEIYNSSGESVVMNAQKLAIRRIGDEEYEVQCDIGELGVIANADFALILGSNAVCPTGVSCVTCDFIVEAEDLIAIGDELVSFEPLFTLQYPVSTAGSYPLSGESLGASPDGSDNYVRFTNPTPGEANGG